jgi:FtsZ-binding cell division protein ZapB
MTGIIGTYRYMNELRQLQDMIKNYPVDSKGKGCIYTIYYVVPGDKEWKQVEWPSGDYKRFVKRSEEIIELFEPDALKVILHIKNKKQEHIIRLMPEKHIPVIDGNLPKPTDRRKQRQTEMQESNTQEQGLNGQNLPEYKSESGLGALQMQNLQKDFDIKLLQRDIDQLKKDNQKLEQENKELTESLYEFEGKADKGKLENLGLLIGAGKLLKMDNQSLLGLAGMLMGDGQADMNLLTESNENEPKGGGLDLSGDNPEREESISTINQFLLNIDEEMFRKVITLLQLIEKQNGLVDHLLKNALQQSTENLKSDVTE